MTESLALPGNVLLAAKDFDGTEARTFDPSPNNIDVHEAYRLSIEDTFGLKALEQYIAGGEHKNRAPAEIVKQLASGIDDVELEAKTNLLVQSKLDILESEIGIVKGVMWPKPTDGYLLFCESLEDVEPDIIRTATISSGHTSFILKTYKLWGIKNPDILITDEVLRSYRPDMPIVSKMKPAPFPMEITLDQWTNILHIPLEKRSAFISAAKAESRIVYIGDDNNKDGKLAENTGVSFVHLDIKRSVEAWQKVLRHLRLGDLSLSHF